MNTDESKPLHLDKFAPTAEVPAGTGANAGQTHFIKKAADDIAEESAASDESFGVPLKDMLGIITYCYVRGVFSSKEISEKLKSEPELRKAFGRELPEEEGIKRFRRKHAEKIEELLETVYRVFPPTTPDPNASPTEFVHREAVERLHDASWEDTMRRHLH